MKEFIDKLIERLEEEKNETYSEMTLLLDKEYLLSCNMNQIDLEEYRCSTFEEVISIVNELAEEYKVSEIPTGSEDCCEWRLIDYEANVYDTTCRNPHILLEGSPTDNSYEFCPYCGKKIKVAPYTEGE